MKGRKQPSPLPCLPRVLHFKKQAPNCYKNSVFRCVVLSASTTAWARSPAFIAGDIPACLPRMGPLWSTRKKRPDLCLPKKPPPKPLCGVTRRMPYHEMLANTEGTEAKSLSHGPGSPQFPPLGLWGDLASQKQLGGGCQSRRGPASRDPRFLLTGRTVRVAPRRK